MSEKKRFEACLIRTDGDLFIVAGWDQLVTAADKSKLRIGSCVGYKRSAKKREKIIRGTIIVIGKLSVCEQQKKLLTSKTKKKKSPTSNADEKPDSENESVDAAADKTQLDLNNENSSDSNDGGLYIDSEEETNENDDPKQVQVQHKDKGPMAVQVQHEDKGSNTLRVQHKDNGQNKDNNPKLLDNQLKDNTSNVQHIDDFTAEVENRKDEKTASQSNTELNQNKQNNADLNQHNHFEENNRNQAPKRKFISLSAYQECQAEIAKLNRRINAFETQWMPRPTDPSVIRYFERIGTLLSSSGEANQEKGELLEDICNALHLTEVELHRLKKENGTKTARAIVRACFPWETRLTTDPDKLEESFRGAIHDYVELFHGLEGLSKGKINESINNVFRSARSQQKRGTENHN